MKIGRLIGLCLMVPMLMGMQSRCSMPPEVTSPLPVRGDVDQRLAGYWYLVEEGGDVTHTLRVLPQKDSATLAAFYTFFGFASVGAEATRSIVQGRSIYSVKRATEPGLFNWTGIGREPGFIFVEPRLDDADQLHLNFMNPKVIDQLAKQGRISAELIEVFRYDDTGERIAPSERDKQRQGMPITYYLINLTEEELAALLRTVPMDELFSAEIGPFHRANLGVEQGKNFFMNTK
jgi:hypothetical protein